MFFCRFGFTDFFFLIFSKTWKIKIKSLSDGDSPELSKWGERSVTDRRCVGASATCCWASGCWSHRDNDTKRRKSNWKLWFLWRFKSMYSNIWKNTRDFTNIYISKNQCETVKHEHDDDLNSVTQTPVKTLTWWWSRDITQRPNKYKWIEMNKYIKCKELEIWFNSIPREKSVKKKSWF